MTQTEPPVIEIRNLYQSYGDLEVLKGVDITARKGGVVALIGSSGSGLVGNNYFGFLSLILGFFMATAVGVAKASPNPWARKPAELFIFVFRGSPLFFQFFLFYEAFVPLPKMGFNISLGFTEITLETRWLTRVWLGALIVLVLNTAAYSGKIFYGALKSIPLGDVDAADACGLSGWSRFRRVIWPTMLCLASVAGVAWTSPISIIDIRSGRH